MAYATSRNIKKKKQNGYGFEDLEHIKQSNMFLEILKKNKGITLFVVFVFLFQIAVNTVSLLMFLKLWLKWI